MAKAGKLSIDVEARVAKLESGLAKATKSTRRYQRGAQRSFNRVNQSVSRLTRGIVALAGTVGLGQLIKKSLDSVDKIDKLSRRLGVSTEALSELQFAAELTGVKFETFTLGLQRMTRRVAEAAEGAGEAKGAIKELGLEAGVLVSLSPDRQLEMFADALSNVESQSDRVRLAMKLFDSEGVALLQTIQGGSDGLNAMRDEARKLGLSLSEDMVGRAVEAKDALTKLSAVMSRTSDVMAIEFSPSLVKIADGFREHVVPIIGTAIKAVEKFGIFLGGTAAALVTWAKGDFKEANEIMKRVLDDVFSKTNEPIRITITGGQDDLIDKTKDQISRIAELNRQAKENETTFFHDSNVTQFQDYKEAKERELALQQRIDQSKLSSAASILGSLSQLVGSGSKKQFEQSKKLAQAETLVSTYAGAQQAFTQTPGPIWVKAAAAVAATTAGLARLASINRTSFGSAGGSAASSSGGGTGNFGNLGPTQPSPFPGQGNQTETPGQTVIIIQNNGGVIAGDQGIDEVVATSVRRVTDNDTLIIDPESRQAQEILSRVPNAA